MVKLNERDQTFSSFQPVLSNKDCELFLIEHGTSCVRFVSFSSKIFPFRSGSDEKSVNFPASVFTEVTEYDIINKLESEGTECVWIS